MNSKKIEKRIDVIRTFLAIIIALVIAFIVIALVSDSPINAIKIFLFGPLSNIRRMGNIIEAMIPLLFTGVGVCIIFAASQANLAAEGSFFIGGVAATAVAIYLPLPAGIHPIVAITIGGIAGSIITLLPAILYIKWDAIPIVSSLMLNYIALYTGLYFINHFMRDVNAGYQASYTFLQSSELPIVIEKTRIHAGIFIAILVVIFGFLYLYKSKYGYETRITGMNKNFAKYSGIPVAAVLMSCQWLGGFLAGMGGATEVLGLYSRFQYQNLSGHGFDGVLVAILAKNNPKFVPIAALFIAYIRTGADVMYNNTNIPVEIVAIVQACLILLVSAERFLNNWRHKIIVRNTWKEMERGSI
jgi:simple sugar transport system permease protein